MRRHPREGADIAARNTTRRSVMGRGAELASARDEMRRSANVGTGKRGPTTTRAAPREGRASGTAAGKRLRAKTEVTTTAGRCSAPAEVTAPRKSSAGRVPATAMRLRQCRRSGQQHRSQNTGRPKKATALGTHDPPSVTGRAPARPFMNLQPEPNLYT